MELSVPVMIYWVLMFYSFFHVLLNIQAELTRFGDRAFYLVLPSLFRIGGTAKTMMSTGESGIFLYTIGC